MSQRKIARELAKQSLANDEPHAWFELLYRQAAGDAAIIPWADLQPNPNLTGWLRAQNPAGSSGRVLVVGCGLGDDAELLSASGWTTTAFDISETAIEWCRQRFPETDVTYAVANLLDDLPAWGEQFELVVEIYTLQVIPRSLRFQAMQNLADCVAPRGNLLVISRARDEDEPEGEMPWPLTRRELEDFRSCGLTEVKFEDFVDDEQPPVRRFRVLYARK